ncbi:hypothetical protein V1224_15325 [Lachnospiraceae bacterium JLR.KK008]
MFSEYLKNAMQNLHYIGIVLLLLGMSILFQIVIGVLYQKMLRETDNMAVTEHKLLKQCKLKFTNCFELNEGSVNIPVFVDKFLNQIHFAGVSMTNITHLSGQFMLFSIFAAGVGVCQGIIDGSTLGELVPYYIVSLFGLYLYFSISSLVDAKGKKNMVRTNLIDYLENHLIKHLLLLKEEEMQPYILKDAKEDETGNSLPRESTVQTAIADGEQDEQDELEELLREFLA